MEMKRVLVVAHGTKFRNSLITILQLEGYHALGVGSYSEAKALIKKRDFTVILIESTVFIQGEENSFLNWKKRYKPGLRVIVMSENRGSLLTNRNIPEAVDGIVWKPFQVEDVTKIISYVEQIIEQGSMVKKK